MAVAVSTTEPVPPEHTTGLVGVILALIPGTTVTLTVPVLVPGQPVLGEPLTW